MAERDPTPPLTLVDLSLRSQSDAVAQPFTLRDPDTEVLVDRLGSLGRFEELQEVGRGGAGRVFRAWDPTRGEHVALKVMMGLSASSHRRFKREFRELAEVSHPNLVKLHELFSEQGRLFFSMEFLEGSDFVAAHRPQGRPDYIRIRAGLRQLIAAVHALHVAGSVHCDIKPSNIMVTHEGRVVLLDFGLIRALGDGGDSEVVSAGRPFGTPAYMSPEQAVGAPMGPASDWYAVGLVLFEAIAGRRPFAGSSREELMQARLAEDAPALSSIVDDVPADLDELCTGLLGRHPDQRPEPERILRAVGASLAATTGPEGLRGCFVGRDLELATLRAAFEAVAVRGPSCVLVHGPSGIGKSELIREFLAEVRSDTTLALSGRCYERESIPYKAFDAVVDAIALRLRDLERRGTAPVRVAASEVLAISRLFPGFGRIIGLSARSHDSTTPMDDHAVRARAFSALKHVLGQLSGGATLVLALDDLQWCDMDSAVLLLELLRPPSAPPMLLVASHRSAQNESNPALRTLLSEFHAPGRTIPIDEIQLGPLGPKECLDLAQGLLATSGPGRHERAQAIAVESDGSPFFVGELVRQARRDDASVEPENRGSLSLEVLMARRIQALPDHARRALHTIAVAGHRIEQGVALEADSGHKLPRSALDVLRSENLIRSQGVNDRDWVEPFHDRIRECVLNTLQEPELKAIHLQLAETLSETGRADPNTLATHFASAGAAERAVTQALDAASAAADAFAFMRAAEWLELALALIEDTDPRRGEIEVGLARAYGSAGHAREAAQAYIRAAAVSPDERRPAQRLRAAFLLVSAGNLADARRLLDELLAGVGLNLPRSRAAAVASLLWLRARIALRGLDYRERSADELPAEELHRIDLCWAAGHLVPYDRLVGGGFIARHLLLALDAGEPSRIAPALALEAVARFLRGPGGQEETLELVRRAEDIAERCDSNEARAWVAHVKPPISLFQGRWRQAADEAESAAELLGRHVSEAGASVMTNRYLELWAKVQMGEWDGLEPALRQLLQSGGQANALHWGIRGILAVPLALAQDQPDAAIAEFEAYRASPPAAVYGSNEVTMFSGTICAYLYAGRVVEAWAFARERRRPLERGLWIRDALTRCVYHHARAQAALAQARAHDDRSAWKAARSALQRLENTHLALASSLAQLGRAALASMGGDEREARRLCRQCVESFEDLDMAVYAAVARHRLGAMIGRTSGLVLQRAAVEALSDRGVRNPAALVRAFSAGFARP